ncbi:MAG: hypothetical protein ABI113_00605 [Mucilaginibacter sp.]
MAFNKIKTILALLPLTWHFSCAQPKHKINPEARKLNDSAINIVFRGIPTDSGAYKNAISVLNQATNIDSDYYIAYKNRFSYQSALKQYGGALESAKHMLKLHPNDPNVLTLTGEAYEWTGDKKTATSYYEKALPNYNKLLDTMSIKNRGYSGFVISKATVLTLLNKKEQSDTYIKEVLKKDTDPINKEFYEAMSAYNRNDLLYWKTITVSENANPVKH